MCCVVFTIPVLVEEEARRIEYQLLAVLKPEIKLLWLWSCRKFKAQIKRSKRTEVVKTFIVERRVITGPPGEVRITRMLSLLDFVE